MKRKVVLLLLTLLPVLSTTGCQDYKNVDDSTIVIGLAIDYSDDPDERYAVTLEALKISSGNDKKVESELLVGQGDTFYETIQNAGNDIILPLYFGNLNTIILSHQIAEQEGLGLFIDTIMREFQIRETLPLVISQSDTARDLLTCKVGEDTILSQLLKKNLKETGTSTNSIPAPEIYQIYSQLSEGHPAIALPGMIVEAIPETEQETLRLHSLAVFDKDRMVTTLDVKHVSAYLMLTKTLYGGWYSFDYPVTQETPGEDTSHKITFEVVESLSNIRCDFDGQRLTLRGNLRLIVELLSLSPEITHLEMPEVHKIEALGAAALVQDLTSLITAMQDAGGHDIFGFNQDLYRNDYETWLQLKDDWPALFQAADIDLQCDISIETAGALNDTNLPEIMK